MNTIPERISKALDVVVWKLGFAEDRKKKANNANRLLIATDDVAEMKISPMVLVVLPKIQFNPHSFNLNSRNPNIFTFFEGAGGCPCLGGLPKPIGLLGLPEGQAC